MDIKSWNGRVYVQDGGEEIEYESLAALREELQQTGTPAQLKRRLALWEWLAGNPRIDRASKLEDVKLETQIEIAADVKVIESEEKPSVLPKTKPQVKNG